MAVHLLSFIYGAFWVLFLLGLSVVGVVLWLATPVKSNPYHELPVEDIGEDREADKQSISMFSKSTRGEGDLEEYHCGWVYVTFEFHEAVQINLAVLQHMRGASRPSGVFFMILQKSSLYIYDSEAQKTCLGVTNLDGFVIDIFPHSLLLDEIYRKDVPIRISNPTGTIFGSPGSSVFVYAASGSEKEDWLVALRKASGGVSALVEEERRRLDFGGFMGSFEKEMGGVDVDGTGQLISALLTRVLFNVHKAEEIERLIREKFVKRTETLPKPFFMGDLVLEEIDVGRTAPIIANGRLHSASHHGELVGSLDFTYPGGVTLKISTQVTTPVVIPIVVQVTVRRLAGRVMVRVKPPPSDRLWFGFYRLPDYDISVDPIVSNVAITWSFVQTAIMKKIEEALLEFVVLPNMDDINIPPLVSGSLFVGERPFEMEPVPRMSLETVIDKESYSAEGLSRRTPSLVQSTELSVEGRQTIETILRLSDSPPSHLTNRKIFVAISEQQLEGFSVSRSNPEKEIKED